MVRYLNSFGRRIGKRLGEESRLAIANILPQYQVMPQDLDNKTTCLEIGFGTGDHLFDLALKNPDAFYVGCEPFLNGVSTLIKRIHVAGVNNIFIWPDDVRILLDQYKAFKFNQIYILFPDPWPKRKQFQRRLINSSFLQLLSGYLKETGKIHIATDHDDYAKWIANSIATNKDLISQEVDESDFASVSLTRYFKKTQTEKEGINFFSLSRLS